MNVRFSPFLALLVLAAYGQAAYGQAAYGQADPFASKDGTSSSGDPFNPNGAKLNPPKDFSVSKSNTNAANKKLFRELWDALQNPRFKDGAQRRTFWITQAADKVGEFTRYLTRYEAVILKNAELFEDSNVSAWVNPAGVYDFKSVGAGMRRVQQFKEALAEEDPDAPTEEEFVERLKAGESFTVRILDPNGCASCNGDGKMSTLQGGGNCETCQGTGESLQTYILKW